MHESQQPRRRLPFRAFGPLLALTLAACPSGDGGDPAARRDSAQADPASPHIAAADSTCTTPPPIPPDSVLRGPWERLTSWIAENNVTFPDDSANVAVDTVPLCPNCTAVGVRLQSGNSTPCITPQNSAERRIAGKMVLLDTFPAQSQFETIPAGETIYMFSRGTPGASHPATLVYRHNGQVTHAPVGSWRFNYCDDGHTHRRPQAQWRQENPTTSQPGQGKGKGPDDDEDGPGGTYGWMACANGCCQFYTPPGMVMTPEQASPNAPDTVPPVKGLPPPAWCTRR
jgi:hypothetical protein